MQNPRETVQTEPRKSLFVLALMSTGGLVLGTIILLAGLNFNSPIAINASIIFLIVGVLGLAWYFVARKRQPESSSSKK